MFFRDACIPVRLGWSSPFARWQGPLAEVSSLDLAVQVTGEALASRGLPATEVTGIVLGWTVPQPEIFYGASTVAARIGAPHATGAMLSQAGLTRESLDEVTLLRYRQYQSALADDRAFQRGYMVPVRLPGRRGEPTVIDGDVGVHATSAAGLAKLAPVDADGLVTYGTQTHPADGTAGLVVTTAARARELARGEGIARVLGTGVARVGRGEMPKAPVPAAVAALDHAGLSFGEVNAVTTHNPFAVNDLWFSDQSGIPLEQMNSHGCSLIYGHPQGPTGARLIVELLHTLRRRGGGIGLFTGCAAGDTGAAVVVRVED